MAWTNKIYDRSPPLEEAVHYMCVRLNHTSSSPLCVGSTGCSDELIVLTWSLLSLDWLNHIKYGPLSG